MHRYDNAEALLRILREPRRNKYFYGKRMDVQHFQMEQDYGKQKQWLLNRLTLGKGVLCGLKVSVDGGRVCVEPGVAIDGLGREIIVPLRYCLDPVVVKEGCCDLHGGHPAPAPDRVVDGLFTLWLCYRECLTDHQPVLVSECGTRDECAAGTIVETFCLKFGEGMAPPLADPPWCARLWDTGGRPLAVEVPADQQAAAQAALKSRRHLLCELFGLDCDPPEGDPCVPLALVQVKEDQPVLEACLVRPRIFSNQQLLDLILCLADKLDECCGKQPPPPPPQPLQVRSIDFIRLDANGTEHTVTGMATPLEETEVDIEGGTNAIRFRFTRPLATDVHIPATHPIGDADFALRNVQVLPEPPRDDLPWVPGTLVLEQPDTFRFDLSRDSPYARGDGGWQTGRYRIRLRGDEDLAQNRPALADPEARPLDGEPVAPGGGVISGNGGPGGDFTAVFVVSREPEPAPSLLHVRGIEFLGLDRQVIDAVRRPDETTSLGQHIGAIRFSFDHAFASAGPGKPSVAGINDANFRSHNVQLRLPPELADRFGSPFIASTLSVEDATTFRLDLQRGTRLIRRDGRWPVNLRVDCEVFLRGTADATGPELADANGVALDGEPRPPSGGVMSGDGAPGGDFSVRFAVFIPG